MIENIHRHAHDHPPSPTKLFNLFKTICSLFMSSILLNRGFVIICISKIMITLTFSNKNNKYYEAFFLLVWTKMTEIDLKNQICVKNIFNWCENHSSWFRMERMTPYRLIRTTTKKQTASIQGGEDLCGSRVGLETSHTGEIGYWPDPDLSRHWARAHCWWGWEAETSHWCLVTTQGLKTEFIQYYKTFWQFKFWSYICAQNNT